MRDLDIRAALDGALRQRHASRGEEADTRIIHELGLCRGLARIDLAVVNGLLSGYEIKSDRDTLDRLPGQRAIYERTLDQITVVASGVHVERLKEHVSEWWGAVQAVDASGAVRLETIREPDANPQLDPIAVAELLWRDEALALLEQRGLAKGVRGKPRSAIWQRLATNLALDELRDAVRHQLKTREGWRSPAIPT